MHTGCLLIQHFLFRLHAAAEPRLRGRSVIVGNHAHGVVDCSPGATAAGIQPGMRLQTALARTANTLLVEPDHALYQHAWDHILDALQERGPIVEDGGLGLGYLGLDGLERLYGTTSNLVKGFLSAVPPGIEARLGLGTGKFTAHIAALQASANRPFWAPADAGAFLSSKSVELLPVPWQTIERLAGFGLRTLGQVAAQQVGPLQAQFGSEGVTIWQLSQGIDDRPIIPRMAEIAIEESLTFPVPTVRIEPVLLGIRTLLQRMYGQSAFQGRAARTATVRGEVLNGRPWLRRIVFREAAGSSDYAFLAMKFALEGTPLPGPLEEMSLALTGITRETGRQASLLVDIRRRENLAEAVQQVRERTEGRTPLWRIQEMESWSRHPERRYALVEYVP